MFLAVSACRKLFCKTITVLLFLTLALVVRGLSEFRGGSVLLKGWAGEWHLPRLRAPGSVEARRNASQDLPDDDTHGKTLVEGSGERTHPYSQHLAALVFRTQARSSGPETVAC